MQNLVQGRVKYDVDPPKPSKKQGAPDWVSVKVDVAGTEQVFFCNVGTKEFNVASTLRKGSSILLEESGGKYKISPDNAMSNAVQQSGQTQSPSPEPPKAFTKAEIKERALKYSELYREIYTDLVLSMPAEQAQLGATAVFNQLSRLFS